MASLIQLRGPLSAPQGCLHRYLTTENTRHREGTCGRNKSTSVYGLLPSLPGTQNRRVDISGILHYQWDKCWFTGMKGRHIPQIRHQTSISAPALQRLRSLVLNIPHYGFKKVITHHFSPQRAAGQVGRPGLQLPHAHKHLQRTPHKLKSWHVKQEAPNNWVNSTQQLNRGDKGIQAEGVPFDTSSLLERYGLYYIHYGCKHIYRLPPP